MSELEVTYWSIISKHLRSMAMGVCCIDMDLKSYIFRKRSFQNSFLMCIKDLHLIAGNMHHKSISSNFPMLKKLLFMLETNNTLVMNAWFPCLSLIKTFPIPSNGLILLSKKCMFVFLESSKLTSHFRWHFMWLEHGLSHSHP